MDANTDETNVYAFCLSADNGPSLGPKLSGKSRGKALGCGRGDEATEAEHSFVSCVEISRVEIKC